MRRTVPSTMALQCFETSARYESFSEAARDLNLTQSAVSRQIRQLEEFVQQLLFERVRQRVKLTAAGRLYLAEVTPLLQSLETSTLRLRGFEHAEGSINIGCYPTLASRWLLPHLLEFAVDFQNITTNTITYLNNAQFDSTTIDIGIVQDDVSWPDCRSDRLMSEPMAPVVAPSLLADPVDDPRELLALRLLHHDTRPQSWQIWFEAQGLDLQAIPRGMAFPQFEMVIEATLAGHGISMLPLVLVQNELDNGRLILAHPFVARTDSAYFLLTPNNKTMIPKINVFRDWLLSRVGAPVR